MKFEQSKGNILRYIYIYIYIYIYTIYIYIPDKFIMIYYYGGLKFPIYIIFSDNILE